MRTGLRRIARVSEDHFDTRSTSFVHYLLLKPLKGQRCRRARTFSPALIRSRMLVRSSRTIRRILRSAASSIMDLLISSLICSTVVSLGRKPFEVPVWRFWSHCAETSPTAQVFVTVVLHLPGFEDSAGRQCGGVVFANINAHDLIQRQVVENTSLSFFSMAVCSSHLEGVPLMPHFQTRLHSPSL